jgi:hypothetical protein
MKHAPLSAIAVGALFAVSGCSAAGSSAIAPFAAQIGAVARVHGRPLATPEHNYIYVADTYANTVWILDCTRTSTARSVSPPILQQHRGHNFMLFGPLGAAVSPGSATP